MLPGGRQMVIGVGSALIDILAHADEKFLKKARASKGGMIYVEPGFITEAVASLGQPVETVPGGSACNTAVGVGMLGGRACFVGRCGRGEMGDFFVRSLQERKVLPVVARCDLPTGRVLSIITGDAQRTMFTYLGAAQGLAEEDLESCPFETAAVVHIEGYLVFNSDFITAVMERAKAAGCLVSLDLASFNVVRSEKDVFESLVADYVDILFANEQEGREFSGSRNREKILEQMASRTNLAVLKLGPEGSMIKSEADTVFVPALGNGRAVDTTGAGDLYAAGFLFGLTKAMPLDQCGHLGAICGFHVCQVVGASIPENRWKTIKEAELKWRPGN